MSASVAAAAAAAGRLTTLRAFCRATTTTPARILGPTRIPCFIRSNSMPPGPTLVRVLRRELCSLQPLHSSIAAASLVSKLPNSAASSSQGRFVNYLSPI